MLAPVTHTKAVFISAYRGSSKPPPPQPQPFDPAGPTTVPSSAGSDFDPEGGASIGGRSRGDDQSSGAANIRTGSPGGTGLVRIGTGLVGAGHAIAGLSMQFRYSAGYTPGAGEQKTAPVVEVQILDMATSAVLATVFTSPPLGNYSYDHFTQYSPPVVVQAAGLHIPTDKPVIIALSVANNQRNLQIPVDDEANGFAICVTWAGPPPPGATELTHGKMKTSRILLCEPPSDHPDPGLSVGSSGYITALPEGFEQRVVLTGRRGSAAAWDAYGSFARALGSTRRLALQDDVLNRRVSYWTDNGAYYCYCERQSCAGCPDQHTPMGEVLERLQRYHREELGLRAPEMYHLDSGFWHSQNPLGLCNHVTASNWSASPYHFPRGLGDAGGYNTSFQVGSTDLLVLFLAFLLTRD